ncbi:hypothetical protein FIBSPDRAFT_855487 [Athelia psychrophila]|uniref:Uncharacterized protein n=1 Tax=Athelia psychrophila TaxID=1759441 RepID=A0A166P9G4_9AGAM|nr:hypothetical protein FIBSPDRAFT_855487 [Fibularhizoctonia sp. CBS 109695]
MANHIRSAKSGVDWTSAELVAYNIKVQRQSALDFFGYVPTTISNTVHPAFMDANLPADEALSEGTCRLVRYLDFATDPQRCQAAVGDFVKELLRVLGFERRGTLLRSRFAIPLTICGDTACVAQTAACLLHDAFTILLVIRQDKTDIGDMNPEPQVIAEAIATFQFNNDGRTRLGVEPLETMTIPAIAMIGTRPVFYKIPITQQLSDAVISGQYPANQTVVNKCTFSPPSGRLCEGMEVLETRREILKYYTAFKGVAEQCWSQFI